MDVKPSVKAGSGVSMNAKVQSNDTSANNSLVSRIDHVLDEEKNCRREQLSRRPSYRKILKELGGSKSVSTNEATAGGDNDDADDALSAAGSANGASADNERQASSSKQLGSSVVSHALVAGNGHSPALRNARSPNNGNGNGGNANAASQGAFEPQEINLGIASGANAQLSGALTSPHFVGLIPAGINMNMMQVEGASQHLGTLLASAGQPAAILQYAQQGLDGQLYIPASANMQAYHMAAAASANSAFNMANSQPLLVATTQSGSTSGSSGSPVGATHTGGGDDCTRKREMRLLKNREAARECRRKKKEYVKCLENRVAVLESQNKTLIDELKSLKERYCSKD